MADHELGPIRLLPVESIPVHDRVVESLEGEHEIKREALAHAA